MRAWKLGMLVVIACAMLSALAVCAEDAKPQAAAPTSDDPLQAIAPYVGGEWKINATWAGGNPLQARAVYEWGVGKKFVNAKTFVTTEKGEYQRYETIFGVKDGKLTAWGFVFDGHVDVTEFSVDGKKLSGSRAMKTADGGMGTLHQSIEL